jgi:organic radical activating enzyme
MIEIEFSDFYITNVCNLNCTDCNRFNNFTFKGHERWADYAAEYAKWAKIVNIKHLVILGGEPMLNPDFLLWVDGLMGLWPNAHVEILTNGTQFARWPELYDRLLKPNLSIRMSAHSAEVMNYSKDGIDSFFKSPYNKVDIYSNDLGNGYELTATDMQWAIKYEQIKNTEWPSCPSRADFGMLAEEIRSVCQDKFGFSQNWGLVDNSKWANQYDSIRANDWPDCNTPDDFYLLPESIQFECKEVFNFYPQPPKPMGFKIIDANGVILTVLDSYKFYETMLKHEGNTVKFHSSDGMLAHSNCCFTQVQWQCFQFARGRLWKCGPVVVFNDFIQQFAVDATQDQIDMVTGYEPGNPNWEIEKVEQFVDNLKYKIDACSLCPENIETTAPTNAGFKKIKILDHRYFGS